MFVLASARVWPDGFDLVVIGIFLILTVGLPAWGFYLMTTDLRSYVRALRGMLIKASRRFPDVPNWVRRETPPCILALGLHMPCSEQDVHRAYRRLAANLHPDRGGDLRRFLIVHEHFEAAADYIRTFELRRQQTG